MTSLTALKVKALRPGEKTERHGDGGGLYLVLRPSGSKAWIQRITIDGRRTDVGLGRYPDTSLGRAREKAAAIRTTVADGLDPRAERRQPTLPTFKAAAERYIRDNTPRWKNPKEAVDWRGSLGTYVDPVFGNTKVDRVTRADVLRALRPIWTSKPSIARKLRQRIRVVFAAAMAEGHIDMNPAGEVIDGALVPIPAVKEHFRALPYQDVPGALDVIEASTAGLAAKLCFRFLTLTAARSGEARGARWDEVDTDARTWTVPASRMKAGIEHRVPLSQQALDVLEQARSIDDGSGLVFPSTRGGQLGNMTMTKMLRSTGLSQRATVHGFRTSLQDVVHGSRRCLLGRGRGVAGASAWRQCRASLCKVRSARATPDAHAGLVDLPDGGLTIV